MKCLLRCLTLAVSLLLASCIGNQTRLHQYILTSLPCNTAAVRQSPYVANVTVQLPVLAPHLEQPGLVRILPGGRLVIAQTRLWAGPLDQLVASTLAENLNRQLPGSRALVSPLPPSIHSRFRLSLHLSHFEAGKTDFIAAGTWILLDEQDTNPVQRHGFSYRLPLENSLDDHYVAQASSALAQLSCTIADTLARQQGITNLMEGRP